MYDIVASIVTFKNNKDILRKAIDSFLSSDLKSYLYLIDNSPTDDLRNVCTSKNVEYVFINNNLGFGAGHNLAIRKSSGQSKYHLMLNPDIFFGSQVLEKIFKYMENNLDIGLISPKICYPDGSIQHLCKLLPSPLDLFIRRTNVAALKKIFKNRLDNYELKFTKYDKVMKVPHLSGCFMFVRSDVFQKVGMFDERFFMYLEDVDLSRRIHRHYRTIYFPEVMIYHEYKKASYKEMRNFRYHICSFFKYFNKWGWFFDRERKQFNKNALKDLKVQYPGG